MIRRILRKLNVTRLYTCDKCKKVYCEEDLQIGLFGITCSNCVRKFTTRIAKPYNKNQVGKLRAILIRFLGGRLE